MFHDENAFKIGCQSIVWGSDQINTNLPQVLNEISDCDYQGVEIGARHLDTSKIHQTKKLLSESGLELVGLHTNKACLTEDEAQNGFPEGRRILDAITGLNGEYMMISGEPSPEELPNLNKLGSIARRMDVEICYHNHYREIEEDYRGLRRVCDSTEAELVGLALDLGWVHRAGEKAQQAINEFSDRLTVLHFKDVVGVLPEDKEEYSGDLVQAVELGEGDLNWESIVDLLRDIGYNGWIVVEQDTTQKTPAESACQSRRYLREACGI